jgi:D-sedoheptulose 7-phosphate isomerase
MAFILGGRRGAANASHAVNDFRKIAGIEYILPPDNVVGINCRVNDDGWVLLLSTGLEEAGSIKMIV